MQPKKPKRNLAIILRLIIVVAAIAYLYSLIRIYEIIVS